MARIYVGTCSWSDHAPFYPENLPKNEQIGFYARHFPIVELDASFYRPMPRRNYELWAERTPDGFLFDVKPYRQITWHDRKTPPDDEVARSFSETLQPLREAGKLGALHAQFPPWFTFGEQNLEYLKHLRAAFPQDRLGIEFRHRSWLEENNLPTVLDTFQRHALSLTVVDEPQLGSGSIPTLLEVTNPELAIVRFHGRNYKKWYAKVETTGERFDYLYSEQELNEWVPNVRVLAQKAAELHVLFNNNAQDYAVRNGQQFQSLLQGALPSSEIVAPAGG